MNTAFAARVYDVMRCDVKWCVIWCFKYVQQQNSLGLIRMTMICLYLVHICVLLFLSDLDCFIPHSVSQNWLHHSMPHNIIFENRIRYSKWKCYFKFYKFTYSKDLLHIHFNFHAHIMALFTRFAHVSQFQIWKPKKKKNFVPISKQFSTCRPFISHFMCSVELNFHVESEHWTLNTERVSIEQHWTLNMFIIQVLFLLFHMYLYIAARCIIFSSSQLQQMHFIISTWNPDLFFHEICFQRYRKFHSFLFLFFSPILFGKIVW